MCNKYILKCTVEAGEIALCMDKYIHIYLAKKNIVSGPDVSNLARSLKQMQKDRNTETYLNTGKHELSKCFAKSSIIDVLM